MFNKLSENFILIKDKEGVHIKTLYSNEKPKEGDDLMYQAIYEYPSLIIEIKNPSKKAMMAAASSLNGIYYLLSLYNINQLPEEVQCIIMQHDSTKIKEIENPTEKVQICALEEDYRNILYIKNPKRKLQALAISIDHYAYQFIKNPDRAIRKYIKRTRKRMI